MFKTSDLENFLKEQEGEWWSPSEIGKALGVDLRTVKNVIRRLDSMTHEGWRMEKAERERIYCVRMVRDVEISRKLIKSEGEGNSIPLTTLNNFPHAK